MELGSGASPICSRRATRVRVESSRFSRVKIGRIARMDGNSIVPVGSFNKEAHFGRASGRSINRHNVNIATRFIALPSNVSVDDVSNVADVGPELPPIPNIYLATLSVAIVGRANRNSHQDG